MGDLMFRETLTKEQWKWLSEIMPSDWESIGDCTYGYQKVQSPTLGISVTYSYITDKYHIEVWDV